MANGGNTSFMAGVPELLLLRLLKEREMYGYEIVEAIRSRTGEAIALGEGVVYPVLHGLEKDGALTARRRPVNGRMRVYYALTPAGARRLMEQAQSWLTINEAVAGVLKGARPATPAARV